VAYWFFYLLLQACSVGERYVEHRMFSGGESGVRWRTHGYSADFQWGGIDMTRKRADRTWYLALVGLVLLVLVIGLMAMQPQGFPLGWLVRGAALLGYLFIFLSIVSSAYMKQIYRILGRPFIRVHHILSVSGLVLVTLHPLAVALDSMSLRVFLPKFDSWLVFLQLGGRPAWYLLIAAALAAVLRKAIGKSWLVVHFLNYVAFLLGTVHAIMIGTDFQPDVVKGVAVVLTLVVVGISIQKRRKKRRR
jgi:sulfoxide reductase heme-binding subunit YedZ